MNYPKPDHSSTESAGRNSGIQASRRSKKVSEESGVFPLEGSAGAGNEAALLSTRMSNLTSPLAILGDNNAVRSGDAFTYHCQSLRIGFFFFFNPPDKRHKIDNLPPLYIPDLSKGNS
ncbi:uncharacterized protein TERG_11917 [Trichophyton rubrum CBS 118892]|uniref:Uncharacterized protein n=1 Tax=Trichophyton rubrum (strain ATCC MYA-4607 / CBS 118892) TaxID=559305 RepID=A0A080WS12_TRIRC|nr:uncharacterized protein TERG_11917 [Trichophyton rubrum CBS 118892]KFL61003.1 hypothetical protein TERG_11917 [Trichophyton rubrum CBS 118892]